MIQESLYVQHKEAKVMTKANTTVNREVFDILLFDKISDDSDYNDLLETKNPYFEFSTNCHITRSIQFILFSIAIIIGYGALQFSSFLVICCKVVLSDSLKFHSRRRFLTLFSLVLLQQRAFAGKLSEPERVEFWHRTHKWPPIWHEESENYRNLMIQREHEVMNLTGADERWENWMQFIQGRMMPTFTELGFEVIQTPPQIQRRLKQVIDAAVQRFDDLPYEEGVADSIYAFDQPKFAELGNLKYEVSRDLKALHEEWAGGIKLRSTSSYGVRLYQNGSTIVMHYDKPQTHVISSIIHIAHRYDNPNIPWHIQIEGHDGKLYSIALEEGQMMFYESAKCLHGRMKMLKGKYYGSLFVHYQPVDRSIWNYTIEDVINAVPPFWNKGITEDHGSRWAGQAITVDSRAVENAPPRVIGEEISDFRRDRSEEEEDNDFYQSLESLELLNEVFTRNQTQDEL